MGTLAWTLGGWAALMLPWSLTGPMPALDLLLLAVSSIATACIAPFDIAATLTRPGEMTLLALVQVGGLGYTTLTSAAAVALGDQLGGLRIGAIRAGFGLGASTDAKLFLRSAVAFTLARATLGTLALWWAFARASVPEPLWQGLVHAVSAFCTAGLTLLPGSRAVTALSMATSASTKAGFETVPSALLVLASSLVMIVLMLVGSAPAGTGGGLRVTTFAALLFLVADLVVQRRRVTILGRHIGEERLRLAAATLCTCLALSTLAGFVLSITEGSPPLGRTAFDVVSFLSNVGLTPGSVTDLSAPGRWVAMALMFAGRLGVLAFALAPAVRGEEETGVEEDLLL